MCFDEIKGFLIYIFEKNGQCFDECFTGSNCRKYDYQRETFTAEYPSNY